MTMSIRCPAYFPPIRSSPAAAVHVPGLRPHASSRQLSPAPCTVIVVLLESASVAHLAVPIPINALRAAAEWWRRIQQSGSGPQVWTP